MWEPRLLVKAHSLFSACARVRWYRSIIVQKLKDQPGYFPAVGNSKFIGRCHARQLGQNQLRNKPLSTLMWEFLKLTEVETSTVNLGSVSSGSPDKRSKGNTLFFAFLSWYLTGKFIYSVVTASAAASLLVITQFLWASRLDWRPAALQGSAVPQQQTGAAEAPSIMGSATTTCSASPEWNRHCWTS